MTPITPAELADILEANGGDLRRNQLQDGLHCAFGTVQTILQWLDSEGLTACHGKRVGRQFAAALTLADVLDILRGDYEDVSWERCVSKRRFKPSHLQEKRHPRFVVVFDADGLFDGLVLTRTEIRYQFEANIPLGPWVMRCEPKRGAPFLCFADGLRVCRVGAHPVEFEEVRV